MGAFLTLIKALPEILALLTAMQKHIDEEETEKKITDNLKTLHEAFSEKDPSKLTALFQSN